MRVATWNLNGLRARLDFLLSWIESRKPDLVGLQEHTMTDDLFPHDAFAALGYRAASHGQKAWNGIAILSRAPIEVTQRGLPGQEEFGARLLTATVSGISFTTVYAPNGKNVGHEDFPRKLAWFDALAAHLERTHEPSRPAILCGDFNICPGPLDSWNEEALSGTIFHTDEERERYRRLIDGGLRDLFRERHPDKRAFSWWDYRGGAFHRKQGLRIDVVLGSAPIMKRVRDVEIDRDYRKKRDGLTPSDHAPVLVDLDG
ncbi:MAG: exodeoxyribonuclease III [Acidobacteriota bacterium]|nr:MAG: exodeoxyribonuclease III [Acidobacteriota bacterium]